MIHSSTHQHRGQRNGHIASPAIVSHKSGEKVFVSIELHRRRTGWRGPVVVVPA